MKGAESVFCHRHGAHRLLAGLTLGVCDRHFTFPLFSISQVSHAPDACYPRHAHERSSLAFVQKGSHIDEVSDRSDLAESATVVVMPRGMPHRNRIGKTGSRLLLVSLEPAFVERVPFPSRWRSIRCGSLARIFIRLSQTLRLPLETEKETIEELVLELLESVGDPREISSSTAPRCVQVARAHLKENASGPLQFRDVAREAQVDVAYLSRAFRRVEGCTMGEYLRRLRVRKAAALIASRRMPLAQVAFSVGFADQSHLSRVFKNELGITPLRYQQLVN